MGCQSDKEILTLICGSDEAYQEMFGICLEEAARWVLVSRITARTL